MRKGYKEILAIVKNDIEVNKLTFGSVLPAETELANKYNVSRPTIAKVYNILQQEGYVVKRAGIGTTVVYKLKDEQHTFGLLLPGAGESEIFSIIGGRFLEHSNSGAFNCLWEGTTASNAGLRKDLIEKCCDDYIAQKVNGVFFAPLERVENADELNYKVCEKLKKAGIPLVLIDRDIVEFPLRSDFDLVSLDNFQAGYVMAQHLIKSGCEVIHYFFRPDSAGSVKMRLYGVSAAVQDYNLKWGNENIWSASPDNFELIKAIPIKKGKTGIICANDSTAAVLISSLDALGVKITTDVLVCGFDDMKYANLLKYPLTSLQQPCEKITDAAIDLMQRRIKDKNAAVLTVNLMGSIILRESSKFKKR